MSGGGVLLLSVVKCTNAVCCSKFKSAAVFLQVNALSNFHMLILFSLRFSTKCG